ncbi:Hint domain-containing protein [Rhodobacteraceae bacterium M382]|nr:Hint domain-containing protein [Rhodobacteraceae bacterium M382]
MDELDLDDIYQLRSGISADRLSLMARLDNSFGIAADSEAGTAGNALHLDCTLSFMSPDGSTTDILLLVEVDLDGLIVGLHLLPLVPLVAQTEYTLLKTSRESARRKFAELASVSFTRGTRITLASGAQIPIEELTVGDRVLTRDDGVQPIRWIGQNTVRATGAMAPVLIRAGALNNAGDLLVSPDHRLFVYQRSDRIGAGHSEILVTARHLINGESVVRVEGGFVDYFQLLFDRHHIIYAEGIAAESLLLDPSTKPAVPGELLKKLATTRHGRRDDHGIDVQKNLLDRPDAIDLLRRASTR